MEKPETNKIVPPSTYNYDYYERGSVLDISGYMNYSWMPELSIRMAHYMVSELPINRDQTILDFGCAKGFLPHALRVLDYEAYGVDVSEYAIEHAPTEIRPFCRHIKGCDDVNLFDRQYDWMLSKDVFEHLTEGEVRLLMERAQSYINKMFVVIPLASDDHSGKYIVPSYDGDITHVIAKTLQWWRDLFEQSGWKLEQVTYTFPGCKENWTSQFPEGNGFFILSCFDG